MIHDFFATPYTPKYIVINTCHGGFGLSHQASMMLIAKKIANTGRTYRVLHIDYCGSKDYYIVPQNYPLQQYHIKGEKQREQLQTDARNKNILCANISTISRIDPDLIDVVQKLGSEKASGECAELTIIEYNDSDIEQRIHRYDGYEELR